MSKYFVEVETETGMACFETTKIVSITLHNEEVTVTVDGGSLLRISYRNAAKAKEAYILLATAKKGVS